MEKQLKIITYLLIAVLIEVLISLVIIFFRQASILDQTRFSYVIQSDGQIWRIGNKSGIGCVVLGETTVFEYSGAMPLLKDFKTCFTNP